MYKGQKFHIECDVELHGCYLIGTNKNGETQTVEDILNSLAGSVKFSNVIVEDKNKVNWRIIQ